MIGDLNRRRGKSWVRKIAKELSLFTAEVPLSEMFGYSTQLRSLTSGRATYTMEPSHFERVPAKIQEEIIKKGYNYGKTRKTGEARKASSKAASRQKSGSALKGMINGCLTALRQISSRQPNAQAPPSRGRSLFPHVRNLYGSSISEYR